MLENGSAPARGKCVSAAGPIGSPISGDNRSHYYQLPMMLAREGDALPKGREKSTAGKERARAKVVAQLSLSLSLCLSLHHVPSGITATEHETIRLGTRKNSPLNEEARRLRVGTPLSLPVPSPPFSLTSNSAAASCLRQTATEPARFSQPFIYHLEA
ncbi:uncharacterized protein [Drosophila pseudoobscura]|uniref:Uncharacterized protein n=1 Tax=Drosophila pseudoobscura pseudoobscura TaxID=46245 RepID=A0A6I8VHL9_DROPS|nr:uncharacterized protein LOC26532600 [Drosophila pseudoobscura]